jgi:hypothetical protein
MKKLLIVLTVLVFSVISVYASITSIAKEGSEAGYPGLLTKGSVLGTDTFIGDLSLLANNAEIDYINDYVIDDLNGNLPFSNYFDGPSGLIVLKSELGILGVSVKAAFDPYLNGVWGNDRDTVGLMYGTASDAMNLGAKLTVGLQNTGYTNKDLVNNAGDYYYSPNLGWDYFDSVSVSDSYIGVKLGAALKGGLDVSLGAAMNNEFRNLKQNNGISGGVVMYDETANQGKLSFDLTGRMPLGNGMTAVLGGIFNMGTDIDTLKTYNAAGVKLSDATDTESNMFVQVNALVGKDIKASDSLTVKIATGATFYSDSRPNNTYKDNMPGGVTTYDTGTKWSELSVWIPLNVAVEGKLNDTWSVNAGVAATLFGINGTTYKRNAVNTTEAWQDYNTQGNLDVSPGLDYALGVTGKIGDLTLDCWIDPVILIVGPNFLTGSTGNNLNNGISLGYSWK